MDSKYDYKKEQEKLSRITFEEADEVTKNSVKKTNTRLAFMSAVVWLMALFMVTYFALHVHEALRIVLFIVDIVIVFLAVISFIPHKVLVHNEEGEITNIHKLNNSDASSWLGTIYVPEISESVEAVIYYPLVATSNRNKNLLPFEEGTLGKVIRIGKAYYVSPSFFLNDGIE